MDYTSISPGKFLRAWHNPNLRNDEIFHPEVGTFLYLEFDNHFDLSEKFEEQLRITDSKFQSINILKSIFNKNIIFRNCIFLGDLNIDGAQFNESLKFLNCEFQGNFIIRNGDFNTVVLDNSTCTNILKLSGGKIKRLIYSSSNEKTVFNVEGRFTFIDSLRLSSVTGMTFFSKQCVINQLTIDGYYNSLSRIDFYEIKCYNIEIKNTNNDGKIYFSNFNHCLVEKLSPVLLESINLNPELSDDDELLSNQINIYSELENNISLYNHFFFSTLCKELLYEKTKTETFILNLTPKKQSLFNIINCSLGLIELRDIPLENMGVKALSSDLSSVKLINTRFPSKIESFNSLNEYYIYNDIYSSANKQNNYRDKIEYYRASQHALLKNIIQEGIFKSFPSFMSIIVSKYASDHGSNWGQALIMTLGVGVLFFCLFVISLSNIYVDFSYQGLLYFSDEILPYLPQFFNPIRRLDFMKNVGEMGGWTGLADISGRILISIGIFEMVRSFRKYVRS